ncbi:MAG: STM4012 family radical SAM protein [Verrucomicrobiales bacterium]|nr:STM4012 family radical SAM protein [Verrucomicrobiales bacterium]
MPISLKDRLLDQPYQGYAYAYPHKTAYRHFEAPIPLRDLWSREDQRSLYLYVHLPFCEMRCGFCNLFTTTNPKGDSVARYLDAVDLQLEATAESLGDDFRFSRGAFGGGTPSFLTLEEIERLFSSMDQHLGNLPAGMPLSFELSPGTVSAEKLAYLRERGVTRFSMGVQSFIREETKALGRPQSISEVREALGLIRDAGAPVMNIDLIYGAEIQTIASWRESIVEALKYSPEEIYLYPLYVRPLTGLEKIGRSPADHRIDLFRAGRDLLREKGYEQISMRLFRKIDSVPEDAAIEGPVYCCQEDGMIGIGAGARSYTRDVHYCTEYAVGKSGINEIIAEYSDRTRFDHSHAIFGCHLTEEERKRRFVMKSLLRIGGLVLADYEKQFGSDAIADFPELSDLIALNLGILSPRILQLNDSGFERSDTIGPWLFSTSVTSKMEDYELV